MRYCSALDKRTVGRRELWAKCRHEFDHEGSHHDPKFPGHYWIETFYAYEFVAGRVKVPAKRKVSICKKCGKQQRSDGAPDACVCKAIGASGRQGVMFVAERERVKREEDAGQMQDDIDWIMAEHARMIEERCEYYAAPW